MAFNKEEIQKKRKKRKERFKRFKRNLRLAKWETHFRVWKRDRLSSLKAESKNISFCCIEHIRGILNKKNLRKRTYKKYSVCQNGASIHIRRPLFKRFGYIYIKFYGNAPKSICIRDSLDNEHIFECKYLHQLFDISELSNDKKITLLFDERVRINRLYVFSKGSTLPEWVQKWDDPCERADVLAMSTHSDDEQLFFAGVLPLCVAKGKKVQLSYFAPPEALYRYNELLDGLWQIGIKNYPVFSGFAEGWSESFEQAEEYLLLTGTTIDDVKKYIVTTIRRFKPSVVIGQDPENGEYGHGQHMFFAKMLLESVDLTRNKNYDTESAEKYGTYVLPKLYLHLYPHNKIILNLDEPLAELGGLSPFQKSQEAFSRHRTQYVSFFPRFLFGTIRHPTKKAAQIDKYSPCMWGLAYSNLETAYCLSSCDF